MVDEIAKNNQAQRPTVISDQQQASIDKADEAELKFQSKPQSVTEQIGIPSAAFVSYVSHQFN